MISRTEMDAIWIIDGLHYRIRDRWVSDKTRALLKDYTAARRRRDTEGMRRVGKLFEAARDADIAHALDVLRTHGEQV